jgi:UDP-2,4-diacetamido-2,4,6-trideoxy-beta-L-altropyranose hydrolase
MLEVVFRTDGSSDIGAGHVMRCLTLAEFLKKRGANCRFVCREQTGNLLGVISQRGFEAIGLPVQTNMHEQDFVATRNFSQHAGWLGTDQNSDAEQTREALGDLSIDWLIVDHYALDAQWERAMRSACGKLMVIDDLADRLHDCDFLVDPGADVSLLSKYRELTPAECTLYVGPRFAIMRSEFDVARASLHRSDEVYIPGRIVVGFGGADTDQSTLEVLHAILNTASLGVTTDVIISITNRNQREIIEFCDKNTDFTAHVSTNQIAALFANADLAIGSGGG